MSAMLGYLVPVVVIAVWLIARHVVNANLFEDGYYGSHTWTVSATILLTGGILYALGRMLNHDKEIGILYSSEDAYTFFFLPVEIWGLVAVILAPLHFLAGITGLLGWLLRLLNLH